MISGTELILGFKVTEKLTVAKIIESVASLDSTNLMSASRDFGNFGLKLVPGQLVVLPSGYVYYIYSPVESVGIRWAVHPARDGESDTVRAVLGQLLERQPLLRETPYMGWFKHLEGSAAASATKSST